MGNQAFALEDVRSLYAVTLLPAKGAPANMLSAFSRFIDEAYKHYEEMTPEALAFLKQREQAMVTLIDHLSDQLPDGVEKRKMKRLVTSTDRKHPDAERLIANFSVLRDADALVDRGNKVFIKALQRFLDFMHDISATIHQGPADFVRINLLYWAVDELTAANFLARRGYTTLAYPHLRSVMEIVDKVELFGKKPEMADFWVEGGQEHEIWKKLSPPRVRESLGRDSKDPIYSHFSHQGAHPTYTAAQMRMTRVDQSGEVLSVGIGVGGKRNPPEQAALMGFCILLSNLCTMHASLAFPGDLNSAEVISVADDVTREQLEFIAELSRAYPGVGKQENSSIGILVNSWSAMTQGTI